MSSREEREFNKLYMFYILFELLEFLVAFSLQLELPT
jgi:hypothetical protein